MFNDRAPAPPRFLGHLGPFSKRVISAIDRRIGELDGMSPDLWLGGGREPNPEYHYLRAGRDLPPGGCSLRGRGQADLKVDRQSCGAAEIAGLDQVAAALSLTRIVFGAGDHPLSSIATLITGELLVERLFSSVSSAIS